MNFWWALAIVLVGMVAGFMAVVMYELHRRHVGKWMSSWLRRDWRPSSSPKGLRHVMFCFVDHYEPGWNKPTIAVEKARVDRWYQDYPRLCAKHRDADGKAPVHTFFFPEEEYRPEHLQTLTELCRMGLGEIEIHLHHDNDTGENLRRTLKAFTQKLVDEHDALPVDPMTRQPRWAFIHGNWCLDNSRPDGRYCGVNDELTILREEGCYADFTFPSAPDASQPSTINSIYYATDDPRLPKSHDKGVPVEVGRAATGDLMIIQGPLGFAWRNRKFGLLPRIENADVRAVNPPTSDRIDAWVETGIHVAGRPEWIFVKVHTHGTQESDMDTLLGSRMDAAFTHLEHKYNDGKNWKLHYVSARELYNIVKAAEAGRDGDPGEFRDFIIPRPGYRRDPTAAA